VVVVTVEAVPGRSRPERGLAVLEPLDLKSTAAARNGVRAAVAGSSGSAEAV